MEHRLFGILDTDIGTSNYIRLARPNITIFISSIYLYDRLFTLLPAHYWDNIASYLDADTSCGS